jgi:hypothetical protein
MAQLALPLIALGACYILSNKNDNDEYENEMDVDNNIRENFTNMKKTTFRSNISDLPNTSVINENFPNLKLIELKNKNYVKQYFNPNQTTDSIFDPDKNQARIIGENSSGSFNSLTGNKVNTKEFNHNNMVPFFRGNKTGQSVNSNNQILLESRSGSGTERIKRVEQAPLFKPEENNEYVFGMPNQSDFFHSRQIPSSNINNVLPWEQKKVAPGLGLGFTTEGSDGYNSGMMDRKSWKPLTVDELRVKTNPRETFSLKGHEGPAESKVNNLGKIGNIEKNRPNTDFEVGPDRWFTTANIEGPRARDNFTLEENNRSNTTNEYFGVKGSGNENKQNYFRGNFEPSNRQQLPSNPFNPAAAEGRGTANDLENRAGSFDLLENNRNNNCQPDTISAGGINGTFRAILAPVIDVLRPTRKNNVVGNANITGNVRSLVPNLPVTNPDNPIRTTIRDTTGDRIGLNHLNVSHIPNSNGAYITTEVQVKDQERNIGNSSNFGNIQGQSSEMDRSAWARQRNSVSKIIESRPNPGGMDIFNNQVNYKINRNDIDRVNNRAPLPDKLLARPNTISAQIPSLDNFGTVNTFNKLSNEQNMERINPDILSAFKTNPYAQPLNSC